MKYIFSIWLVLFPNLLLAQDFTMQCGKDKLGYENGNKGHFSMVVHCPYKVFKDNKAIPKYVVDSNTSYLLSRVGKTFLCSHKVKLEGCYIIDFNNKRLIQHENWVKIADHRVKYAFEYSFIIQQKMEYYFTTVYDSMGNLISDHQLPNCKENTEFAKIIDVCKAKKIAESDTIFSGSVQNISLQYLDSTNTFIWQIEMTPVKKENTKIFIERYLTLIASSGAVIKRETKETLSAYDDSTPPRPNIR